MTKPNRILIVDDDNNARRIMSMILKKKGYKVDTAANGEEALAKVGQTFFNAALLDVRLPDMEGLELLAPLRRLQPEMVSFVVTGHASLETAVEAVNQGAAGYITKPIDMEEMVTGIENALEKQRLVIENRRLLQQVQAELNERKKAEEQVKRLLNQQIIINKLALSLGETRELNSIYHMIYKHVRSLMDVQAFIVSFYNPVDQHIRAGYLVYDDEVKDVSHLPPILLEPKGQGAQSEVIWTGKPLYLPDLEKGMTRTQTKFIVKENDVLEEGFPTTGKNGEKHVRSAMFVPMKIEGETIGVIQAQSFRLDAFSQEDVDLLLALANVAVISIQNARLLESSHRQAQQMKQILEAVPDGVFVLGPENRILIANPTGEAHLQKLSDLSIGDKVTQLGGRSIGDLLIPNGKKQWHELETESPDVAVFEAAARPLAMSIEGVLGWVFVVRDVTQQREIQQRTQQQQQLATVGQLAAGIAHDFNNLLAVIVLYTQLALHAPDLPIKVRERLLTISNQAQRASELIQQILDFSRRSVLERHPLNLRPFLKEQVRLLQRTLPENVRIQMNYGEGDFMINADPTRIQQALLNLAINARDAMPHGGDLHINLDRICLEQGQTAPLPEIEPGDWVILTVTDTGTGIQPEVLSHIFEPFFTTKEVGKGSGLGLAQVYGIVKQHKGHVDVTTKLGEGTQFVFYLPALPVTERTGAGRQPDLMTGGSGELILVVEDDPVLRTAVTTSLESLNYRVVEAANGRDAVALFDEYFDEISLVLSDLVMPGTGGKELLKILKEKRPSLRAIVMTGHLLTEELDSLKSFGMVEWLQKPLRLEQLAEAVARTLAE